MPTNTRREETDGLEVLRKRLSEPRDAAIALPTRAQRAADGVTIGLRVERGARARRPLRRYAARRGGRARCSGHQRMITSAAAGPFGLRPPRVTHGGGAVLA